jgi:multidrug resistance efflux pump
MSHNPPTLASEGASPKSPQRAREQGSDIRSEDSVARLARLKAEFDSNAARPLDAGPESVAPLAKPSAWQDNRRVWKAAAGLLLLAAVGWIPVRALLQSTSTEAVVNARLISLRAPIEGQVEPAEQAVNIGTWLVPGQGVLRIVNTRAERGRLDDLRRLVDQLENERVGIAQRIVELTSLRDDLANQVRIFQDGRLRQLTERAAEMKRELAAALINRDTAAKALARIQPMASSASVTEATLEKYTKDARVTAETHAAVEHRLAAIEVELQAAQRGTFIGDTYNDRPRSSQRGDEVAQRLGELTADLREREARIFTLRKELADETKRHADNSAAELVAPVASRVWEMLTAPGESVVRGQDLVRLLDCSGIVITATVGESVYNSLHIGQSAVFHLRGEQESHAGQIVGLTGVSAAPANLAIQPSALAKESYRVTVKLTDPSQATECKIGRTGRVTFGQ